MPEICLMEILDLPEEALRVVIPKTSTRMIARILLAYPRTARDTFARVLSECVGPHTMAFLQDEMRMGRLPTMAQIREAEAEMARIVHEHNLYPHPPAAVAA